MYEYPNKSKPTRTTLHEVFSGLSNSSAINNRETVLHIRPAVSETEGIFADFSPWSGLCHIWVKSIHAVLFSLYISCIWWSLSAVFAAGRKSNGRFAFKPLGRFIASPPFHISLFGEADRSISVPPSPFVWQGSMRLLDRYVKSHLDTMPAARECRKVAKIKAFSRFWCSAESLLFYYRTWKILQANPEVYDENEKFFEIIEYHN